jgi:hypothetical protein
MFVKRFSARSAILWCLAAGCAVTSASAASFAEIQRIKNQVAIPHWKEAAAHTQAAWAQESNPATLAIWRALDQQTDPLIGKAPLEEATSARDAPQRLAHASWLRWRILSGSADARYSFVYAQHLSQMRDKEGDFGQEAVTFYFHAKLALVLDGNRCTDRRKAEHLMEWYPAQKSLQPLLAKIAKMGLQDKSIAIMEAVSLEEMLGERPAMGWLCPRREAEAPSTTPPPRYLSDAAWRTYRTNLLEQLTRNAMKDL